MTVVFVCCFVFDSCVSVTVVFCCLFHVLVLAICYCCFIVFLLLYLIINLTELPAVRGPSKLLTRQSPVSGDFSAYSCYRNSSVAALCSSVSTNKLPFKPTLKFFTRRFHVNCPKQPASGSKWVTLWKLIPVLRNALSHG